MMGAPSQWTVTVAWRWTKEDRSDMILRLSQQFGEIDWAHQVKEESVLRTTSRALAWVVDYVELTMTEMGRARRGTGLSVNEQFVFGHFLYIVSISNTYYNFYLGGGETPQLSCFLVEGLPGRLVLSPLCSSLISLLGEMQCQVMVLLMYKTLVGWFCFVFLMTIELSDTYQKLLIHSGKAWNTMYGDRFVFFFNFT